MSQDPDRYDPARAADGPADNAQDRTLPDLLGPGTHEDERVGMEWALGLLGILLFLALVAVLFGQVLSPP